MATRRGIPGPYYQAVMDFSGGVNDTSSETNLHPSEASVARNIDLDRDGALTKRLGADKQNTTTPLSGEIGMIHQHRPSSGVERILVAHDDKIQEWGGGDTFTELLTGLTADQIVVPADLRNLLHMANGQEVPMCYYQQAGSAPYIFKLGAPQPSGTLVDGGSVAGNLADGTYKMRVRYYNIIDQTFMGEPHPEDGFSFTVSGGPSGWRITGIPTYSHAGGPPWTLDHRIVGRVIERTLVGGGIYYIDGYITDNTTTQYDFVDDDNAVGAKQLAPDLGFRLTPSTLFPIISYGNRVVGHNINDFGRVEWSEIDEFGLLPHAFTSENYLYLDLEDHGDAPVAVSRLGEYMIWWCGRSIHLMHIDDAGIGYSRRLGGHKIGWPNARCVAELPGGNLAWSFKGPYFFDGTNLVFIGERIEKFVRENINKAQLANMFHVHRTQERRRQVKFFLPKAGSSQNDQAAVYHYRRVTLNPEGFPTAHAWTFHDGFASKSGTIAFSPTTNEEDEYTGNYAGEIFTEDVGDADDHDAGGAIQAEYTTAWLDLGSPHQVKNLEEIWVFIVGEGSQSISVEWDTAFGSGPSGSVLLEAGEGGALFDVAKFDEDVFAMGGLVIRHARMGVDGCTAWGKYFRLRFSNYNADEPFTIAGVIVKYSIDRDREDASS